MNINLKYEKRVQELMGNLKEENYESDRQKTYIESYITDSIDYAKRIQNAILPDQTILQQNFNDYFISFKPRNSLKRNSSVKWFIYMLLQLKIANQKFNE